MYHEHRTEDKSKFGWSSAPLTSRFGHFHRSRPSACPAKSVSLSMTWCPLNTSRRCRFCRVCVIKMDWQWRTLHTAAKQESASLYPDTLSTKPQDARVSPHAEAGSPSHLTVRATKKSVQDHGLCGLVRARCSVTLPYVVAVRCRIVGCVTRFWAWLCWRVAFCLPGTTLTPSGSSGGREAAVTHYHLAQFLTGCVVARREIPPVRRRVRHLCPCGFFF